MTRTTYFAMELLWKVMLVLALALGLTAHAAPQVRFGRHAIAASDRHSVVLGEGGSIWLWGSGSGDTLGIWPEYEVAPGTPIQMPGMTGAISVSAGEGNGHSLALMLDGTVQAWGPNFYGELGNGSYSSTNQRVQVLGLTNAAAVAAGYSHSLAVKRDGTVWAWGDNGQGQLGNGTTTKSATPLHVPGLTNIVAVAAGGSHSLALRADGTVWAWGSNFSGQLGDGTQDRRLVPVRVLGLSNVVAIDTRNYTSYAVRADGTVWAWGNNGNGQAGLDTVIYYLTSPVMVPGLSRVVSVAAGSVHALALRADGSVWSWGGNFYGQLGLGMLSPTELPHPVPGVSSAVAVAAGEQHSLALKLDGTLLTWGHNRDGAMGTGTDRRNSPVRVAGLGSVRTVAASYFHTLALLGDGSVWGWGSPEGYGGTIQATPAPVGLTQAKAIAAGSVHSLAVRQDGTVWAWGDNSRGQLGDGAVGEPRYTPAPVQGLSEVVEVAAGDYHSLALKEDGTVWAWGANQYSQLGDMTLDDQRTPVQVLGLEGVAHIYASRDMSVALKQDGTVWMWGSDWSVWDFSDMMPLPPAQVEGLSGVVSVSTIAPGLMALLSDGTVWQWYLDPTFGQWPAYPIDGLTDAAGLVWSSNTTQLLHADGTVWNLGANTYGERGFPSGGYSFELEQIPGLTGVVSLTSESATLYALREDGSLLTWGSNMYGTIGDGVSSLHLAPTRVLLPAHY